METKLGSYEGQGSSSFSTPLAAAKGSSMAEFGSSRSQNAQMEWMQNKTIVDINSFNETLKNQLKEIQFWHWVRNKESYKRNQITNKFHCCECGKQLKTRTSLMRHYGSIHTKIRFGCPLCDKKFTSYKGAFRHFYYIHNKHDRYILIT